jgi:aspartyl-tRNA(Asn)/glutamyl-tRNA(Gln) amidotransferase subunit A
LDREVSRAVPGRREVRKAFDSIDLLVMPTTGGDSGPIPAPQPAPAPGPGGAARGGAEGFGNTSKFSYYGLPATSVPCGFTASGRPSGLQIASAPFAETAVLTLVHALTGGDVSPILARMGAH